MDAEQREIYTEVDNTFEYSDDIDCKNVLVKCVRLQQICNDPGILVDTYKNVSPKLKYIVGFALKNKKQFIVMSKQVKTLKRLEDCLLLNGITYSKLYGNMNLSERNLEVNMFKSGDVQILVAQLDVAREALTLPEAEYTIFLDRDFAQGYNEQAEARMTPIDGKPHTKFVIDLVMKDSIEESIYDILINRKESINDVNVVFKGGA
jgi:SNF2 family DNA or RNA helicase